VAAIRITLLGVVLATSVFASANGVVPARTGGFGEMTCSQCHADNPLNDPSGAIALAGVSQTYTPGSRYAITVTVSRPQLVRTGFQLSARIDNGPNRGNNAGTFFPLDTRTEVVPDDAGRVEYIQHTSDGTTPTAAATGRWRFVWLAPSDGALVVFHLAGNAANGDGLPRGDYIYTAIAASRPADAAR
jgi:hypothetical protein